MKIKTVWTLRGMSLRERLRRTSEAGWRTAAAHLPHQLAYWSFIHSGVRNIHNDEVVPDVTYNTILGRMRGPR